MPGSISLEEFLSCASQLTEISDSISDGWTHKNKEVPEASYLMKRIVLPDFEDKSDTSAALLPLEEPLDKALEDDNAIAAPQSRVLTWEYHVLYSASYAVPTLYFNVWKEDGSLLSLDQIWQRVQENFQQQDRWSVLTQQEHPILRRPFYMLHPCRTGEFLDNFKGKSANILVTWLSSVGPAVGMTLPAQYGSVT
ncbi:ubiquitin-like-conjugating enzyme ATG10 [Periplaneta americana]|uniref:ubiquitin-like-conjugating enzyme ATG10 n=1 Tax=Periplaneta americana TaxID=6978 RepID=UPI0037E73820